MRLSRRLRLAFLGVGLTGILAMLAAAALWIVLAPQQQWIVYPKSADLPDGQALSLPLESYFRFTSIAMFSLLAIIVAIVVAVAAWQLRFARGPMMTLALAGGLAIGSGLGLLVGHLIRSGVDPDALAAAGVGTPTLVQMPASISGWSMAIGPGVALVIYTLAAAWHGEPDLGRPQNRGRLVGAAAPVPWPPAAGDVEPVTAPIPVTHAPGIMTYGQVSPADGMPRTDPSPGTAPR